MKALTDPSLLTLELIIASLLMFAICMWSAKTLIGWRGAWGFAALSLPLGWFAEQMGSSRGWFFGQYTYTDVLGPPLGNVPLPIPLMWFALTWLAWLMACLILWRQPVPDTTAWSRRILSALLAAMIVTAFDLGADPYFVYVLRAWIMQKTDGGWFGETLKGFSGWMEVSFVIVLASQVAATRATFTPAEKNFWAYQPVRDTTHGCERPILRLTLSQEPAPVFPRVQSCHREIPKALP